MKLMFVKVCVRWGLFLVMNGVFFSKLKIFQNDIFFALYSSIQNKVLTIQTQVCETVFFVPFFDWKGFSFLNWRPAEIVTFFSWFFTNFRDDSRPGKEIREFVCKIWPFFYGEWIFFIAEFRKSDLFVALLFENSQMNHSFFIFNSFCLYRKK